jgi:glycine cleavage system aminomethyltransferase T
VRNAAGLFEIFGQFLVEIAGPRAEQFLNETLVADFTKVPVGGGVYCGMLNEAGGFIDHLSVAGRSVLAGSGTSAHRACLMLLQDTDNLL